MIFIWREDIFFCTPWLGASPLSCHRPFMLGGQVLKGWTQFHYIQVCMRSLSTHYWISLSFERNLTKSLNLSNFLKPVFVAQYIIHCLVPLKYLKTLENDTKKGWRKLKKTIENQIMCKCWVKVDFRSTLKHQFSI